MHQEIQSLCNQVPTKESVSYDGAGKAITLASMYLLTGEADYVENTIIDGDLDESGPGTVLYLEDNSNGNSTKVTLSGFTLTNGSSNGGSDDGGGLYAFELDSLIIDNMIVDGNYNAKQGHDAGGITIKYADFVKITNTTISNNTADRYSGIAIVNSEDVELLIFWFTLTAVQKHTTVSTCMRTKN